MSAGEGDKGSLGRCRRRLGLLGVVVVFALGGVSDRAGRLASGSLAAGANVGCGEAGSYN